MEENKKLDVLDILKLALDKEKGSFTSLSGAANILSEKRLKKTLNKLALEELKHIIMVMDLSQISQVNPFEEIDLTLSASEGTFAKGARVSEEEALQACMHSELESISLYMDLVSSAREQEDDDVLRLLQQLIKEEEEHRKILEKLLETRLKEI